MSIRILTNRGFTQKGEQLVYREDFSDPATGWPNHADSRYTAKGYELSFEDATHKDSQILVNSGPLGIAILAAYGPWWDEYHASLEVDADWVKMHAPHNVRQPKPDSVLYGSSAGLVFRVNDAGFYAFLVSTTTQAYEANALSFKLVRKTYGSTAEVQLVTWTRLADKQIQQKFTAGLKLSVECVKEQVSLYIEDQQVARIPETECSSGYSGACLVWNRASAISKSACRRDTLILPMRWVALAQENAWQDGSHIQGRVDAAVSRRIPRRNVFANRW
jgi:hypothetical protein